MANLARRFEVFESANGLVIGRVVIGPVDEQQVDPVGLQTPEAALGVGDDVIVGRLAPDRGDLVPVLDIVEPYFGYQDDLFAPLAQRLA